MRDAMQDAVTVLHNKVPNRIRLRVPLIKQKQTYAGLLKHSLLNDERAKGIYHAEPNIVTGTILIKFHPAFHSEEDVLNLVSDTINNLRDGNIEISQKHKNPKLGKMEPGAFFTRELLVSIVGNVVAGLFLAVLVAG